MGLFVLTCLDQPDALSLRMSVRDAHLAYVRATHPAVRLGGPFLNADGEMIGSMMIVEAENMAAAEAFSAADLIVGGTFAMFGQSPMMPKSDIIAAYAARCVARTARERAQAKDDG